MLSLPLPRVVPFVLGLLFLRAQPFSGILPLPSLPAETAPDGTPHPHPPLPALVLRSRAAQTPTRWTLLRYFFTQGRTGKRARETVLDFMGEQER